MNKIYFILAIIFCFFNLYAKDIPIYQIEKELTQAEKDFQIAKKMFNPWYGGPLLTGSGNVMPPGYVNINPQVQLTDYYAEYNKSRKSVPIVDIIEANPTFTFGFGVVDKIDMVIGLAWDYQEQSDVSFFGWQDNFLQVSFAILKEKAYVPAMKIYIKEIFPTGKYKNLDPNKINIQGLGDGSYKTQIGLGVSKVVWWWLIHPMQFRLSLNYGITSKVKVKNFNTYGGGYGTNGKINPKNYFKGSFACELSISQKVVLALDLAYEYYDKKTFKGIKGTNNGSIASVGSPFCDILSLAPAMEYNFTTDISIISGVWFSICGRNKNEFVAGIINLSFGF